MALKNLALIILLTHTIILSSLECSSATRIDVGQAPTLPPLDSDATKLDIIKSSIPKGEKLLQLMNTKIGAAPVGSPEQCLRRCSQILEQMIVKMRKIADVLSVPGTPYDGQASDLLTMFPQDCSRCFEDVYKADQEFSENMNFVSMGVLTAYSEIETMNS